MNDPEKISPSEYLASLPFDRRLALYDIRGSIAHAKMLAHVKIVSEDEANLIVTGLVDIGDELERGDFPFDIEREDIHMNIEARLIDKIGPVGGKLHTARSRNDQIALDLRLFLKEAIDEIVTGLNTYQQALLVFAEKHIATIIPGYTHLQRAQPILLAHQILAYFEMAQRDKERFKDCYVRADVLPLGSGALAGVPYEIDRMFVAKELGFMTVSPNSIDAVSDRDFIVEFEAASSILMMHFSRLAEEIILWSSDEFGFMQVGDDYVSGSSIMPQKRNPDIAELARGKTGRVFGNLIGFLTTLKGLPLAYNRDLQEDKEGLFDTVDTVIGTLDMMAGMATNLSVDDSRTREAAEQSFNLATDIADYLVAKGMPFRDAHGIAATIVKDTVSKQLFLQDLSVSDYKKYSDLFDDDILKITVQSSIDARQSYGGTATIRVQEALATAHRLLGDE